MSEDAKNIVKQMMAQAQQTAALEQLGFGEEFAFALKQHNAFVQELAAESNPGERLQQLIAALVWSNSPEFDEGDELLRRWSAWSSTGVNWRGDKSLAGFLTTLFTAQQVPLLVALRERLSTYDNMVEWALLKDWEIRQYFRMGPRTFE
jgi:hypothetical protein